MGSALMVAEPRDCAAIEAPPLRRLHDYWSGLSAGRACPRRAELRPEEFARALPYVALIEKVAAGPGAGRLRIRLTGEEIRNPAVGYRRGAFVDEIKPEWYRRHLVDSYTAAFAGRAPIYQRVVSRVADRDLEYQRLMLPLSSGEGEADMLMVATVRSPELAEFMVDRPGFK
jgi:hypothetical protein